MGHSTLPDLPELRRRFHVCDQEIHELDALLATEGLSEQEKAGAHAHRAVLMNTRSWYLARIRRLRPIEAVGVAVDEVVQSEETAG